MIAVFPEDLAAAQQFMSDEHLQVSSVQHVDLSMLGVNGTPTMFLVNSEGRIVRVWFGELSPDREKEVLRSLQL
jgi:hypothetical protein